MGKPEYCIHVYTHVHVHANHALTSSPIQVCGRGHGQCLRRGPLRGHAHHSYQTVVPDVRRVSWEACVSGGLSPGGYWGERGAVRREEREEGRGGERERGRRAGGRKEEGGGEGSKRRGRYRLC